MQENAWAGLKIGDIVPDSAGRGTPGSVLYLCRQAIRGTGLASAVADSHGRTPGATVSAVLSIAHASAPLSARSAARPRLAVIQHDEGADSHPFDCDPCGRAVAAAPCRRPGNAKQSIRVLQGVFQILFWRCAYRLPWWNAWRELTATGQSAPHGRCFRVRRRHAARSPARPG